MTGGTLGSAGEAEALARIFPRLPAAESALIGPGDDAAVLAAPDGRLVITTDTMSHGPDFRRAWSSPFQLGWKAAATNLADVAAMGARPTALVVALIAPADTPLTDLEELADGLREACAALAPGCGVVGGDLSVSDSLTLAVTAFGSLDGRAPVLRSGARPGDIVAASGLLGFAGAGIALLFERGVDAQGRPSIEAAAALRPAFDAVLDAQLTPRPPIGEGVLAADAGATAMLDVSDGLVLDARRIAAASGVAVELSRAALEDAGGEVPGLASQGPAKPELRRILFGGEDHALLAAFPAGTVLPGAFRRIGQVVEGSGVLLDGAEVQELGGWDPYSDWDGAAG